jgi:hypothetical protein
MLLSWPNFVVSRRINRPLDAVQAAIAEPTTFRRGDSYGVGTDGALTIDSPFRLHTSYPGPSWRATGRLFSRGSRAVARVELEVAAWSGDDTELTVRPMARHPERWGRRRLRRYFALAHESADRSLQVLRAPITSSPPIPRPLVKTDS